jgi:hypothetical protein
MEEEGEGSGITKMGGKARCQLMHIKIEMLYEEEENEDKFTVGRVNQQS